MRRHVRSGVPLRLREGCGRRGVTACRRHHSNPMCNTPLLGAVRTGVPRYGAWMIFAPYGNGQVGAAYFVCVAGWPPPLYRMHLQAVGGVRCASEEYHTSSTHPFLPRRDKQPTIILCTPGTSKGSEFRPQHIHSRRQSEACRVPFYSPSFCPTYVPSRVSLLLDSWLSPSTS